MPAWPLTWPHTSMPNRFVLAIHRPPLVTSRSSAFALDMLKTALPFDFTRSFPFDGSAPARPRPVTAPRPAVLQALPFCDQRGCPATYTVLASAATEYSESHPV